MLLSLIYTYTVYFPSPVICFPHFQTRKRVYFNAERTESLFSSLPKQITELRNIITQRWMDLEASMVAEPLVTVFHLLQC